MAAGEAAVRMAFARQAEACEALGSPFTARLCIALDAILDRANPIGRRVLGWPGLPDALHDSVPLRLAGGLHALVRRGSLPDLARLYPPRPLPDLDALRAALRAALSDAEAELAPWLDSPPQTNEVARSAVLMAGYLVIAERTGLPLSLLELGASAGLNLQADRYAYRLGGLEIGTAGSPVRLAPTWTGPDPPAATLVVVARRGVDLNPLDVTKPADRERLLAYVWPDQAERLARLQAALAIAMVEPPPVDRADAAAWLEARLAEAPQRGVARVVAHSIAFQYFPADIQARIAAALERASAAATAEAPLAWLRFEFEPGVPGAPSLRLRLWPGGEDRLLARVDAHARAVEWKG